MSEVIWAAMIAAGSGLVGAAIGSWLTYRAGHREMDIKMIEVAVGILAAEPDKTKGLRNWAVDTLAHYSKDVELTDEAKNALREKPLPVYVDAVFTATGAGRMEARSNRRQPRGGGAHGAEREKFETPMPPKKA